MSRRLLPALILLLFACKKQAQPPPAYSNYFSAKVNGKPFVAAEIRSSILPLYILSGPPSFSVSGKDTSGLSISLSYSPYNNFPVSGPFSYSYDGAHATIYLNGLQQTELSTGQFTIANVDTKTYEGHQVITGVFEGSNLQVLPAYQIAEGKFSVKN